MRLKPTNSVKNREHRKAWHLLLTRWQLRWAGLGTYLPYFQLGVRDYLARLKATSEHIPNEALFSAEEIEERRSEKLAEMEQVMLSSNDRFESPSPGALHRVISRINPFSRSEPTLLKNGPEIGEAPSVELIRDLSLADLFSREERQQRLEVKLKVLKRDFRSRHRAALAELRAYKQLVENLPEDDLDVEIAGLEHDYIHLGRVREWYDEFHTLVREVLEVSRTSDAEFNEDPTRLLQRDFLSSMKSRLETYRRLNELRREAFRLGDAEPIRLLSYLKSKIETPDAFIDRAQDISVVKRSLAALEYQLGLKRAERAQLAQAALQHSASGLGGLDIGNAYIDQSDRLDDWLQFKRNNARDLTSLKRITDSCEDWRQQVAMFESELHIQRLENHGLSPVSEHSMVEKFVREMVTRIDQEIETDIAFQESLRKLVSSGDRPEMLNLALEQLKLARSKPDAATAVPEFKAEFLKRNAGVIKQEAEVIPLFQK